MTLRSNGSAMVRQLLFWWILFVVLQSVEHVFLLREAVEAESPSPVMLVQTLLVGLRGDFIVETIALALASIVGIMAAVLWKAAAARGREVPFHTAYRLGLRAGYRARHIRWTADVLAAH